MFVFENVPGILSANNGGYLNLIFESVREAGYELEFKILNSKNFNVLQDRKRVIIIGWEKSMKLSYPDFIENEVQFKVLKDLFSDLPKLKNGQGVFGLTNYSSEATDYLKLSNIRTDNNFTTQHISRPNNPNDLEIYQIAVKKWINDKKRLNYAELPTRLIRHSNTSSFTNRFQVVNHDGLAHTVVAHISKDGHYYISLIL